MSGPENQGSHESRESTPNTRAQLEGLKMKIKGVNQQRAERSLNTLEALRNSHPKEEHIHAPSETHNQPQSLPEITKTDKDAISTTNPTPKQETEKAPTTLPQTNNTLPIPHQITSGIQESGKILGHTSKKLITDLLLLPTDIWRYWRDERNKKQS